VLLLLFPRPDGNQATTAYLRRKTISVETVIERTAPKASAGAANAAHEAVNLTVFLIKGS
jgi:hypothetical protein